MMPQQPRTGQAYHLRREDNTDLRTTHVAVSRQHGFMYFCRFDPDVRHGQADVPEEQVRGTYWITPCDKYGSCYHGSSLWQGGFDFFPIEGWDHYLPVHLWRYDLPAHLRRYEIQDRRGDVVLGLTDLPLNHPQVSLLLPVCSKESKEDLLPGEKLACCTRRRGFQDEYYTLARIR